MLGVHLEIHVWGQKSKLMIINMTDSRVMVRGEGSRSEIAKQTFSFPVIIVRSFRSAYGVKLY